MSDSRQQPIEQKKPDQPEWKLLLLILLDMSLIILYATLAILVVLGLIESFQISLKLETRNYWLSLLPIGYVVWLLNFLTLNAIEMQFRKYVLFYSKRKRSCIRENWFNYYLTNSIYHRVILFRTLPLVKNFQTWPYINRLYWLSYATTYHMGKDNLLIGFHFDPDLIYLGNNNIVGHGAVIVAHTIILDQDGDYVLITAPVRIGSYVVIGAESHIELGVEIEDYALVEVGSFVKPFTKIGKYEVWGGNPAKLIRKQDAHLNQVKQGMSDLNTDQMYSTEVQLDIERELKIKRIVSGALHRPLEMISEDISYYNCANWDSVAQLDMGLQLERTFGVVLTPEESMQLHDLKDIRRIIKSQNSTSNLV